VVVVLVVVVVVDVVLVLVDVVLVDVVLVLVDVVLVVVVVVLVVVVVVVVGHGNVVSSQPDSPGQIRYIGFPVFEFCGHGSVFGVHV
jgi:hypothetical protein